jgi:hypothetical protein
MTSQEEVLDNLSACHERKAQPLRNAKALSSNPRCMSANLPFLLQRQEIRGDAREFQEDTPNHLLSMHAKSVEESSTKVLWT